MKRMNKLLNGLLAGAFLLCVTVGGVSAPAKAAEGTAAGFNYTVENGGATITGYTGDATSLVIPDELEGKEVLKIGSGTFKGNTTLLSVTISDKVEEIGSEAFSGCTSLSSVVMSKNLETIGYDAFYNCDKLESIEIPKSLKTYVEYEGLMGTNIERDGAFRDCDGLKSVTFEDGWKEVPFKLFANCPGIEKIVLPDSVTIVSYDAFYNCSNLSKVTLSENLETIGEDSFSKCVALYEVDMKDNVETIYSGAFSECSKLAKINLPKSLTTIYYGAFDNCDKLESIEIPKSLKTYVEYNGLMGTNIERDGAFRGCDGLKSVTFEDGWKAVPFKLFANCPGIEEIVLPDSVTIVSYDAFYNCTNLSKVTLPESLETIGQDAFAKCAALREVDMKVQHLQRVWTLAFFICFIVTAIAIGLIKVSGQDVMMSAAELNWYYLLYLFGSLAVVLGFINLWMYRHGIAKIFFGKDTLPQDTNDDDDDEKETD